MVNVALTSPGHIPANLLRDIDPWQLLMSAGAESHQRATQFHQEFPRIHENLHFTWTQAGEA